MLRVSTKGRYGLRAMVELAREYGGGPVLAGTIAERQGISRKYLLALLPALKKAGLIKSVRGAQGGFLLAGPPDEIGVGDIVASLEGPIAVVHCCEEGDRADICSRAGDCEARPVWQSLNRAISSTLNRVTLGDLLTGSAEQVRLSGTDGPGARVIRL